MPRFDRTGPDGQGSQTGRGLGKCNPDEEKRINKEQSYGSGRKKGGGLGKWFGLGRRKGQGGSNS